MWSKVIGTLIPAIGRTIDSIISDKAEAEKLKAMIQLELLNNSAQETSQATRVILAEARGDSWLQRNWRPVLMLSIVAIVVNNYLLYPYLQLFGVPTVVLDLPPELYNLMTVGVGGYVMGRSAEKVMASYTGDKS